MKRATVWLAGVASAFLTAGGLLGCVAHGEAAIPPTAQKLAEGQNMVSATPAAPGTVYVYDKTDDRLIYSGMVNAGDHVVVDSGANAVTVNGATVTDVHLHPDHEYEIEFNQ